MTFLISFILATNIILIAMLSLLLMVVIYIAPFVILGYFIYALFTRW